LQTEEELEEVQKADKELLGTILKGMDDLKDALKSHGI
jgi:hypothetical protein